MLKAKIEDDPLFKRLLKEQEIAIKKHRRNILELRKLYTHYDQPDIIRAALIQQEAHDSEFKVRETTDAISVYGWEIVPFGTDPEHLTRIKYIREQGIKRLETIEASKPSGPVLIITNINGIQRKFMG